jgi:quercetin dioxygenase-like cupin family protein
VDGVVIETTRHIRSAAVLFGAFLVAGCATSSALPDPLTAGWNGERVCEQLHEDARQRILRCTFPPSVGHERHYHNEHFGYVLAGGRLQVTDASGTRETDYVAGVSVMNAPVEWHEVLNTGDTTAVFLIVESK